MPRTTPFPDDVAEQRINFNGMMYEPCEFMLAGIAMQLEILRELKKMNENLQAMKET